MGFSHLPGWILIVFLLLILHHHKTVLARAVPSFPAGFGESSKSPPDPSLEPVRKDDSASDRLSVRCILPTPIEPQKGMSCTTIDHDSSLRKASIEFLGTDSHLHTFILASQEGISTPAANLYPCWFEPGSEVRRLRCKTSTDPPKNARDSSGLEGLVADLLNGIPLTIGPQLPQEPSLDAGRYHVLIYPFEENITLVLVDALQMPQHPGFLLPEQGSINFSKPLVYLPRRPDGGSTQDEERGFVAYEADVFPELSEILHCWFQENKYETAADLNCGVNVGVFPDPARFFGDDTNYPIDSEAYREQLNEYLAEKVIDPIIDFFTDDGWERDMNKVPIMVAKTLIFFLIDADENHINIATFDWSPVVEIIVQALFEFIDFGEGPHRQQNESVKPLSPVVIDWLERVLLTSLFDFSENGGWNKEHLFPSDSGLYDEITVGTVNCKCHRKSNQPNQGQKSGSGVMDNPPVGSLHQNLHNGRDFEDSRIDDTSTHDTVVENWFRCWNGSGSKLRCEIPDQGDFRSHRTRRDLKDITDSLSSPFSLPLKPLHLLPDKPRIRYNCNFDLDDGRYRMKCPIALPLQPNSKLSAGEHGNDESSSNEGQSPTLRARADSSFDSIGHLSSAIISEQSGFNQTSYSTKQNNRASAFGRATDTFAFIGFFTVLAIFTILLSCLLRQTCTALYELAEKFEEWIDGCWRKQRTRTKDTAMDCILNEPAPSYISAEPPFDRLASTLSLPQVAVLSEVGEVTASSTGSQMVDEGTDTMKRKRAAARAALDEEQGDVRMAN